MMKQRFLSALAVGLLVLTTGVFTGCEPVTNTESPDFSGTATNLFLAHGGSYVGEATVTTDRNGVVTEAILNEWHGPDAWVVRGSDTAFVGGEIMRLKMPGKNATSFIGAEAQGYVFFYYNVNSKGWVELSLPTALGAWSAPSAATAAVKPNWDARMALPLYRQAYVAALHADNATDLVTVTISDGTAEAAPVITVGAKASTTARTGHLNKSNPASTYMPVTASSIGYHANVAALVAFFKANPTAPYGSAVATTGQTVTPPSATYTAATDTVWVVADALTGATYSDFPNYAVELQNAYLLAIADKKGGDLRALR